MAVIRAGTLLVLCLYVLKEVSAVFLPGSCIEAGFTGCCSTNETTGCAGVPPSCFCDPSCYQFDDCCSDIAIICAQGQNTSDGLLPLKPLLLSAHVTFHSATIQWAAPSNTSLANESYSVNYYIQDSVALSNSANVSVVTDEMTASDLFSALLTGLDPGTTYFYTVVARNQFGSVESETESFTTMEYPKVAHVRTAVVNSTAVTVSWSPLQLPSEVTVSHYTVCYSQIHAHNQIGNYSEGMVQIFPSSATNGVIGGLESHASYQFQVSGTIVDVDGTISVGAKSNMDANSIIFVPGAALLQLRGGPFQACSQWDEEVEAKARKLFRSAVLEAINNHCNCRYSDSSISNEIVICEDRVPTQAVYRANVGSIQEYTADELLGFVESETLTHSTAVAGDARITLDDKCPMRLRLSSDPLCIRIPDSNCSCSNSTPPLLENSAGQDGNSTSPSSEPCVGISVLIAALMVEFFLFLAIAMAGAVIFLLFSSKWKQSQVSRESATPEQHSVPNVYAQAETAANAGGHSDNQLPQTQV